MASTLKRLQIPLEEVVKATNNFDEEYVIGGGGFGKVYKGQLLVSGEMVDIAARRLDSKHRGGDVEFWTEISVLSSLKHENIASLIGFCDENGEKIIINKREASKGSLSMYLSDPTLSWIQRLNICVGVARALRYIHNGEGRDDSVIHRNVNSYTVLLDDNWEAKLSGFEFSIKQSVNRMDHVVLSEAIGTKGYMDPSIVKTGGVSHKSDIYSFGVVLCEILCGRKAFIPDVDVENRFVATLFRANYEKRSLNNIIHPDLRNQVAQQSLVSFSKAAYSCLQENRAQRPKLNDIVIELEKALELQLPLEYMIKKLGHLKIPLDDILKATENFSMACQVSHAVHYHTVYIAELEHFDEEYPSIKEGKNKGELPRRRSVVLIYRFHPIEGEEMFYTEIKMLDTCKHPGIVKLLGFCYEGSEMIIAVECLSNGYLFSYWLDKTNAMRHILTWEKRLKICLDVANALNYLHTEMEDQKTIIHRDIKSSNIVLDENFGAKIVGFGFSEFLPPNQDGDALYHKARGGMGAYMDPEYRKTGKLKRESDVYSFGVVLLEVLCGRLAYDAIYEKESNFGLAFVARRCFQEGTLMEMIDPILKEKMSENGYILKKGPNNDSLEKFVKIAHGCIAETQDQRPTMKVVIEELEQALFFELKRLEHLKIPLSDIMLATDNFSKACYISRYYNVYRAELKHFDEEKLSIKEGKSKGELHRRRNTVHINRFRPIKDSDRVEETFHTGIKMLDTCKHPSIVKLLGFCDEGSEMILVVEHLFNGYLFGYWLDENIGKRHILTWEKRLKICLDVANALNYLHNKTIIHCDIKSSNIALDENWGAKIVDFGKSVFLPPNQDDNSLYHEITGAIPAYTDPEYMMTGKLKRESDVYSFGVVMFEVLCGKLAYEQIYKKESISGLAFVARRCFEEGTLMEMIDPILKEEMGENSNSINRGPDKDSLEKFVKIAHECIAETQGRRPTMKVVIKELQEALFLQEEQLQHLDMVHVTNEVEELMELKLTRENSEDKSQRQDMVQAVQEVKQSMELKLIRANSVEHLQPLDMAHVTDDVEESSELKLTRENSEDNTHCPHMVQVVDELEKSMEPKLTNANSIQKLEHLKIPLNDILLATEEFSMTYHIRNIPHYSLYRAELEHFGVGNPSIKVENKGEVPKRSTTVVIYRLLSSEDKKGEEVFYTQIQMLGTCKHPSIVKLLGFCDELPDMIFVVEHLSNGSLDDYWLDETNTMRHTLTWAKRLKICLDVANALNYLHTEMEDQKTIIHCHIKSSNISLDENWGAKIIGFGISVFLPPNQDDEALYHEGEDVWGEYVYADPEYWGTGKLKRESDVYSYGVVLFEVLCGRLAGDPVYKNETLLGIPNILGLAIVAGLGFAHGTIMEMIDPILKEERGQNNFSLKRGPNKDSLEKFVKIANDCIALTQDQRPTMKVVIKELQEALFLEENKKDEPIISLEIIRLATQNFHRDNCIGGGGFGKVYKGEVPQGDGFYTIVAKQLDTRLGQGEQQFRNELQILFEYKHENIIPLVGYCDEKNEQIIVYEYASQGSLDRYLKDAHLTWVKRLNICIDVATALAFLHGGSGKQAIVIHRDIKTANILLNDEWNAKLADFGLSLISPINQETDYVIDHACGTRGYSDPLYLESGFLTKESDIYSFGVVLFEILCGRSTFEISKQKGQYLPGFINESYEKGKHDDLVFDALKEQIVPKALTAFKTIAYQCLHDDRERRPTAKEVLKKLLEARELQISGSD